VKEFCGRSGHACVQGDILIEQIDNARQYGLVVRSVIDGSVIIAEGEATGHRHLRV
jgi:hypothetical protein